MSAHRFFLSGHLPADADECVPLAADDVRHAVAVLRVRPGEIIDVVDPDGRVWSLLVSRASAEGVFGVVQGEAVQAPQPHVALFQGVAKGEKMDDIVRHAVEIGADQVVPLITGRSIVKLDARKRVDRGERWRRVARAAAKQAKRTAVPDVLDPVDLRGALPLLSSYDAVIVLWEEHEGAGLLTVLASLNVNPTTRLALVVGPEGGFSGEEIDLLSGAGARAASLGVNILRTETASLVALALAMASLGGLGGSGGLGGISGGLGSSGD